MQSASITDTQHFTVTASPVDTAGKPGVLSTPNVPATWSTSDPTVATVVVDAGADGQTATVSAVAPGTCVITANGTNPAGTFFQGFTCSVMGGNAVGWVFTFGSPS